MKFAGAQIQSLCNPPPLTPRAEALFIAFDSEKFSQLLEMRNGFREG